MTQVNTPPRIYVACLAAYNNGKLHGAWIDALQEPEAIYEAVQAMLRASPQRDAEEWAIHDYEGFCGVRLSEWESFKQVHALATFVEEHGQLGALVLEHYGNNMDDATEALEDQYAGEYENLADFAEELTTESMTIPANLQHYIDYEAMARDMELNGDIFTIEVSFNEVHVFWTR